MTLHTAMTIDTGYTNREMLGDIISTLSMALRGVIKLDEYTQDEVKVRFDKMDNLWFRENY